MKLSDILGDIDYEVVWGDIDVPIDCISYHSDKMKQDSLFVCVEGSKHDGHDYIAQAVMKGCRAIIVEKKVALEFIPEGCTVVQVEGTRKLLPFIASRFYDNPSESFNLVGVTGTNGKTSVTHMISYILSYAERNVGSIGTLGDQMNQEVIDTTRTTPTTPEAFDLQQVFGHMRDRGVTDVVMEVSSMGLELHRVNSCDFSVGIFTNLSPEHLDDHVTFERYKEAKLKLFSLAPLSIINGDDPHAEEFVEASSGNAQTFGMENLDADWVAKDVSVEVDRVHFTLVGHNVHTEVTVPMPGRFTVYNALAAIATCLSLDVPLQTILDALQEIKGPDGRLQTIQSPDGYTIMVDYAHTPDALDNVLSNLKPYTAGKLILVFGCGGDRDEAKRPRMGEIASKWCDHIILTSDNPRTEEPMSIIKDIEKGIGMIKEYDIIEDREEAIQYAMKHAEKEDIILIAGKGNEAYQIVGEEKRSFSDVQVVKQNL